ncbi:MAG TPA: nuclear transport factor 2 family protein [Acidimicrobiales bacterium]|jgi:ketosteroid isomerase-like protein|nr:nuclear transport factor 2 family protein [Acidimicrobiales bacterium]
MDRTTALQYVEEWVDAWNSHDLDRILGHVADHAHFSSPMAASILPDSGGHIDGKDALRQYWAEGLRRLPDLHFEVDGVYLGVDTVVVNYRNQDAELVCEVITFDGDLVVDGHGTYLVADPTVAGV